MTTTLKQSVSRYLDAGFPLLYIHTFEEAKTEELLRQAAERRTILTWSVAGGYGEYRGDTGEWLVPQSRSLDGDAALPALELLAKVMAVKLSTPRELARTLFVLKDAHLALESSEIVAALKEISVRIGGGLDCCVVLISPVVKIPVELEKFVTLLEGDRLSFEGICRIIQDFVRRNELPTLPQRLTEEMAVAFKGLSEFEITNILALAVADDGCLSRKDLQLIFELKKQMILKSGILEMIPLKESLADVGGLENLKAWLRRKASVIKNVKSAEEFGVDMPKGALIAGVPGCGKSLSAKAAAKLFEVPLLRLDVGKLMGKYLGESEANLRKAIRLAEAISPCVLWVDELEKAFAGVGGESGHEVTARLFGSFLTWMQEKTEAVFVVATANDITRLPPELLRKGRFDEIFYVSLPKEEERRKIFEIHIRKRRPADLSAIDLGALVSRTKGYSGADIEGVVQEAVEMAFAAGRRALSTGDLLAAIEDTNALSVTMKEQLEKMNKAFEERKLKNASA